MLNGTGPLNKLIVIPTKCLLISDHFRLHLGNFSWAQLTLPAAYSLQMCQPLQKRKISYQRVFSKKKKKTPNTIVGEYGVEKGLNKKVENNKTKVVALGSWDNNKLETNTFA